MTLCRVVPAAGFIAESLILGAAGLDSFQGFLDGSGLEVAASGLWFLACT